jgi:mRNA-degrading endonuclease toxin of MazEF toxin-antitoxin module
MDQEYIKRFDGWNAYGKNLNSIEFQGFFHAREIWWCALGINIGSEQDGTSDLFERPVLILRGIRRDLLLVIPFTTKIADHPHRIYSESTGMPSQLLLDQLRTISSKRLLRKMGSLDLSLFRRVIIEVAEMMLESGKIETPP